MRSSARGLRSSSLARLARRDCAPRQHAPGGLSDLLASDLFLSTRGFLFSDVREDWDDGNLMVSVNFSPMKDKTDAKLRYASSNFTFSGELAVGGFAPVEALTELVATFDKKLAKPLLERVLE